MSNKKSNKVDEYKSAIMKIKNYGMMITGFFIFGFDTDGPDIFEKTNDFVMNSKIDLPVPQILTPFPGTKLFENLNKQGRILVY